MFHRIDPELLAPSAPILLNEDVKQIISAEDEEARHVLNKVNASKPIRSMYSATEQFVYESHYGFKAVLERGKLGLIGSSDA